MAIRLNIPLKVISESNARGHWRGRSTRTRTQRTRVAFAMLPHKHKLPFPARVTFTRIGPKQLDSDNLQGAFKAVRDEVAKWIGKDDGNPMYDWQYRQEKGPPKTYAIRIAIDPI